MRIVLQKDVTIPSVAIEQINHVAIYSDDDDLLAAMWVREDGTTALIRVGEPDFERLCADMGMHQRTNVRCVKIGK